MLLRNNVYLLIVLMIFNLDLFLRLRNLEAIGECRLRRVIGRHDLWCVMIFHLQ